MADYNVKVELSTGQAFEVKIDGNTRIAPHFKLYEIANTKGKITLPQFVINKDTTLFLECCEEMRTWFVAKFPSRASAGIIVNSLFRQVAFNRQVGGDANSLHLKGLALDWKVVGLKPEEYQLIENQWKLITMRRGLIGGCNWYTNGLHISIHEGLFGHKNFVHRDYRRTKSDW